jgi:hypothetical protein
VTHTFSEIGIVSGGDVPDVGLTRYRPAEDAIARRPGASVEAAFAIDRPFQVCEDQISVHLTQAILPGRPAAVFQVRVVDSAMPVQEFAPAAQPPPGDIDELDIRCDEASQRIRVMSVPGVCPAGDQGRGHALEIVCRMAALSMIPWHVFTLRHRSARIDVGCGIL